jgi:hypothetical protein
MKKKEHFEQRLTEGMVCPICGEVFENVGDVEKHLRNEIADLDEGMVDLNYLQTICNDQLKRLGCGYR